MRVHASGRNAKLVARETEKRLSVEGTWPCVPLGLFSRGAGGGARGWRVSVAAGSHMSGFDVDDWLGGEFRSRGLSADVVAILKVGYDDGSWDEDDVPVLDEDEGTLTTVKEAHELWSAIFTDSFTKYKAANATAVCRESDRMRLKQWLQSMIEGEEVPSTPKSKIITPQCRTDMVAQGVKELWQLGAIELGLALGRPVSREECEGFVYRKAWQSWCPKTTWQRKDGDLDSLLEKCAEHGKIGPLEAWFADLRSLWHEEGDDFSRAAASHVMSAWHEIRLRLKSPEMIVHYLTLHRARRKGRGIPELVDDSLVSATMAANLAGEIGRPKVDIADLAVKSNALSGGGSETAGSVCSGSSVFSAGKSASQVGSVVSNAQAEQMAEIIAGFREMRSSIEGVRSSVNDVRAGLGSLQSRMAAFEKTPEATEKRKCWKCGQTGHLAPDCPNPTKKEDSTKK